MQLSGWCREVATSNYTPLKKIKTDCFICLEALS
jgi:hypothetical protein